MCIYGKANSITEMIENKYDFQAPFNQTEESIKETKNIAVFSTYYSKQIWLIKHRKGLRSKKQKKSEIAKRHPSKFHLRPIRDIVWNEYSQ